MHVEQSPNSPYRSAQDHGLLSSCLFTCHPFPWQGVQPHSWEPQLLPPARPVRERQQSSKPRFERCDCHRETLPRMLSALLGWLRSQLSSWAVRQRGGITAGGWRGLHTSGGSELLAGHRALGMGGMGMTQGRSSSASVIQIPFHRSSPCPLALEMSQGNHPAQVTCPIKQEGRVPPEPEPRSEVAVPAQQGPLAGQLLARQDVLWVPET